MSPLAANGRRESMDATCRAELLATERSHLLRIAALLADTREEAEDLVQEAMARTLNTKASQVRRPRAYLIQAMRNMSIDYRRHNSVRRRVLASFVSAHPLFESVEERVVNREWLEDALHKLTPDQRTVLSLRYLGDWDIKSISDVMDKPEPTVRTILRRALNRMRLEIGEDVEI